jgi:uncharacterized protein YjlB
MTRLVPTPSPRVVARLFAPGEGIPNNPAQPALLLAGVFEGPLDPDDVHALVRAHGWGGTWTWSVFPFHHYHPDAYEVLVVAAGSARLLLGGPGGETVPVSAGDVVALPPGTGHCRLDASLDFAVCGSYPPGQEDYETLRADAAPLEQAAARIAVVPAPVTDPLYGSEGPILSAWS